MNTAVVSLSVGGSEAHDSVSDSLASLPFGDLAHILAGQMVLKSHVPLLKYIR